MPIGFTGSMWITGSLNINGVDFSPVSRSYAVTASHNSNAISSASNALIKTGSAVELGGFMYRNTIISGTLVGSDPELSFNKVQLMYSSDYSQFYTSRSLVDKGYVDTRLTGSLYPTGTLSVTGSALINSYITLAVRDPLPTLAIPTGSFMSSGSGADNKPYYWNGSTWTAMI